MMMMMMVWGYCYFSIEVWTVMLVLRQRRYSLNPKQLQIKITYRSSDAHQRIISNTNHVLPNHCHQRHSSTTVPCNNGVASALLIFLICIEPLFRIDIPYIFRQGRPYPMLCTLVNASSCMLPSSSCGRGWRRRGGMTLSMTIEYNWGDNKWVFGG